MIKLRAFRMILLFLFLGNSEEYLRRVISGVQFEYMDYFDKSKFQLYHHYTAATGTDLSAIAADECKF